MTSNNNSCADNCEKYYIILEEYMWWQGVEYKIGYNYSKYDDFRVFDVLNIANHILCYTDNLFVYEVRTSGTVVKQGQMYRTKYMIIDPNPMKIKDFVNHHAEYFIRNSRGLALNFITDQNEELCMMAVEKNGFALDFVKNKKYKICMRAIETCPLALKYVDNQMYDMCIKAVHADGMALQYVKCKTERICEIAIEENPLALQFVPDDVQTFEMCMRAVSRDWKSLQYVSNEYKTFKLCFRAFRQHPASLKYCGELKEYLETGFILFTGVMFLFSIEKLFVHHDHDLMMINLI